MDEQSLVWAEIKLGSCPCCAAARVQKHVRLDINYSIIGPCWGWVKSGTNRSLDGEMGHGGGKPWVSFGC